jgi:hypothetical protein
VLCGFKSYLKREEEPAKDREGGGGNGKGGGSRSPKRERGVKTMGRKTTRSKLEHGDSV